MSLWWVFLFLIAERLLELLIASRNKRIMFAQGGREFFPETYRVMVGMHALFFTVLIFESYPWHVPFDRLTWFGLIMILLLQVLRYWCIVSLGNCWNTRIILLPGSNVRRRGPYRFIRHPNYLAVTLELAIIPLLCRAPLTLITFSLLNLLVLRERITLEERALRENTNYAERFPGISN